MPEKKKKKQKVKPNPFLDVSILKKFLQTYERHCDEFQSSVSPTIKKGLWSCINNEVAITKFVLSSPETIPEDFPPVLFKPLVKTIRDMRYMLGKELCIWGILLSNLDTASLAIMLELNGRTIYPFCKLEMIDCDIDVWSMERLGKALRFSNLVSIVLDYNEFGDEGVKGLLHGLEGNKKLLSLSLCYCNLGAESGSALGPVVAQTAIQELYLNGNYLQCSGALELITPISMHTQYLAAERQTVLETSTDFAHQILEATESAGIHTAVSNLDVLPTTPQSAIPEDTNKDKKKRKGKKKKKRDAPEAGPWLAKLHLADNGIDGRGEEGETGVVEFTQLLSYLIRYSEHLSEVDLDDNCIGELSANDILQALEERKKGKLPNLEVKVTAQISLETFSSILKKSKKCKSIKKRKKKKTANSKALLQEAPGD
ncbi:uncharacterized protein LOC115098789 isoform X1 [Rhinatrema bivittatum]|uniref:uncharacterized protein LOC115098789 isoform X1 n=1 Tax=Rhinatrema bivittatum TaxID=194408 RepID=UPI00112D8583|nr:uncharacterized protein LOC115098789 isoform X1 [Rhinatrema bivittatum]XP_029471590.1 uncharacterized protein LOC115098789 isoform X1 [Rhinatrema bivittatum]